MVVKTHRAAGLQFLACTLPGHADIGLLRAAARRGATAILNLEAIADIAGALGALTQPRVGRIGVRIDSRDTLTRVPSALLDSCDVLVCTPTAAAAAAELGLLPRFRSAGRSFFLECTSLEEAVTGAELGADALIAKGHEAGGRVGEETTFVFVQRLLAQSALPIWAHGGISTHTASACFVAGCAGVVLDAQLVLARDSSLPDVVKAAIERMTGDETQCLGSELGRRYRVFRRPGLQAIQDLQRIEGELCAHGDPDERAWRDAILSRVAWCSGPDALWPLGQDAAFAAGLAKRFRSVAGILGGLDASIAADVALAQDACPLDRAAPLAQAHRTEYPILQGPMTRVSDTAAFAGAVAESGGLPFLALALLRAPQVRTLLRDTAALLGDRSWGVGILGFVPLELREEQLAVIEEFRPPFAIIAGGRPDQAARLERLGITTYLHVPAPALLKMFVDDGARHFIFEGRECGGHVGPRTSFVLWQLSVEALLEVVARGVEGSQLHVVFAGGIHDARSAAMVSALAAPLVKAGARVGVLIGTAYLFTEEAVSCGAIVDTFQQEAVGCRSTVLLETGPGHATRCAETPFAGSFRDTRRQLVSEGKSPDDVRLTLETLNLGRLRIASKGTKRGGGTDLRDGATHIDVDVEEQRRDGMYMIGQVAALRQEVCRMADLHRDVSAGSTALLRAVRLPQTGAPAVLTNAVSARVAIVGMGCLLPKAPDVATLWRNVLSGVDAIREVPKERFDADLYYDPDRRARDRVYSKWGGFLDEVAFDPLKHGIPPSALPSIDPFQLLTLEVVDQALRDAGYADRPFDRERTSVILGASGGVGDLGFRYGIRAGLPMFMEGVPAGVYDRLPEWTEDSFAGVLLNVAAGRVANRLDLGGLNFTVDAACASSLAAVFMAARELEAGSSDMVLVGGIDTVNSPFGYLCFSSAQALSPRGRCSTFDDSADGIAISEGLTVMVLKRQEDAERDGDRIYAVIRAVAGSSDGRGKGLTAPRPEGQVRVLDRAYAAAGFSPATVGLVEAHGTGTVAGDGAEVAALSQVFAAAGAAPNGCVLGSIKSMIGHTKSAAGVSGLLKVALSLHHKVLPPTLHVTKPNAKLREANTPFYLNTEARPWMAPGDQPRRGGVSSFGFGGTNFHVVVEEHEPQAAGVVPDSAATDEWPAELSVWTAPSARELIEALAAVDRAIAEAPNVPLRAVAAAVCRTSAGQARAGHLRLAMVAEDLADFRRKLASAKTTLEAGGTSFSASQGIFGGVLPEAASNVAFLFPGQGSQYPSMHRDLALRFPDVRHALETADRVTAGCFERRLSSYVFPPTAFTDDERAARMRDLTDTAVAQPALGAVETGLLSLFARLGVRPSFTAGHSYGEYVALHAAGVFSAETLFTLSAARGRFIKEACGDGSSAMAAVAGSPDDIYRVLPAGFEVWIANLNAPRQTVLAGARQAIETAIGLLTRAGVAARRIDVSCAFHSPLVEPAQRRMAALLDRVEIQSSRIPVFSNALATPYPGSADEIRQVLAGQMTRPVRFVEQIDNMYAAGARVFLELGPRNVLTNLVRDTLSGREAMVIPVNTRGNAEIPQLLSTLAQLAVAGIAIDFDVLWRGRAVPVARVSELAKTSPAPPSPHAWMVSGGQARRPGPRDTAPPAPIRVAAATDTTPAAPATPVANPNHAAQVDVHPPARAVTPPPPARVAAAGAVPRAQPAAFSHGLPMHPQRLPQIDRHAGDHDAVMRQFQELMSQFLQTQALVMTTYLQGTPAALTSGLGTVHSLPPAPSLAARASSAAAEVTIGAPPAQARTRQPAAPIVFPAAASTSRSQTHPAVAEAPAVYQPAVSPAPSVVAPPAVAPPVAPPVVAASVTAAEPVAGRKANGATPLTEQDVLSRLVRIVSDRTGYPEEMLSADANIEADLGIDSIKRMEILAAFQEAYGGAERGTFQQALERLTALKTLRESAAALVDVLADPLATAAV